jgi:hypothetical protein
MKRILMVEMVVGLFFLIVWSVLQVYAGNRCAEYGIPFAVYSIPSGVSCGISVDGLIYLVPLEEVQQAFRDRIPFGDGS